MHEPLKLSFGSTDATRIALNFQGTKWKVELPDESQHKSLSSKTDELDGLNEQELFEKKE